MTELRHMDVRDVMTSILANGCTMKCDFIGLMLCCYLSSYSCLGAIICHTNTIAFVSVYACRVCDALVASCATAHLVSMNQNVRSMLNVQLM